MFALRQGFANDGQRGRIREIKQNDTCREGQNAFVVKKIAAAALANTTSPPCVKLSLRAIRFENWPSSTIPSAKAEVTAGNTVTETPMTTCTTICNQKLGRRTMPRAAAAVSSPAAAVTSFL